MNIFLTRTAGQRRKTNAEQQRACISESFSRRKKIKVLYSERGDGGKFYLRIDDDKIINSSIHRQFSQNY